MSRRRAGSALVVGLASVATLMAADIRVTPLVAEDRRRHERHRDGAIGDDRRDPNRIVHQGEHDASAGQPEEGRQHGNEQAGEDNQDPRTVEKPPPSFGPQRAGRLGR